MLTERSIINFLIWVGGLILGPYLAVSLLSNNLIPIFVVVAATGIFVMFGVARDRLCLAPLVAAFMTGRITFLPGKLGFADFGPPALIIYYLIAYTALKRAKVMTGPMYFFVPIIALASIIYLHDHTVGLRLTGGGREGGRGALAVLLAAAAYICGVSVKSPSPQFFAFVPLYCIAASFFTSIPYIVTTYLPSTAPIFYIFSDNINGGAYSAAMLDETGIVRNSGQANFGAQVVLFLLCYFPLYTWWRPNRWWIVAVALVCTFLAVTGGYRSAFVLFGLSCFLAIWCYSTWRAMVIAPLAAMALAGAVIAQNSHVVQIPLAVQRSLAFLPGDWDPEVLGNTKSSNEFRQNIIRVYLQEDAKKSPLLGNGVTYDSAEFARYNYLARRDTIDGYYGTKIYTSGKMFHTGWVSLYDSVGLIGSALFVFFALILIFCAGRMVFASGVDRKSLLFPLKVWIFCTVLTDFVGFFTVFGDFKITFPRLCCFAILWVHLNRLEKFGYVGDVPVRQVTWDPGRTKLPLPV